MNSVARRLSIVLVSLSLLPYAARGERVVLVAGGDQPVGTLPATQSKLRGPFGVDCDSTGRMFIVEISGHRVLQVDTAGILTQVGGTGEKGPGGDGGPALRAQFNGMHSLAVDSNGDLYIADTWNNRVRKIAMHTGTISTVAGTGEKGFSGDGGPATEAQCGGIYCVALDPSGRRLYLADLDNRRVRMVDLGSKIITTVAGNGERAVPNDGDTAATAPLVDPRAVTVDAAGNVYILDRAGHALRRVDPRGKIMTVAGTGQKGLSGDGGPALQAQLDGPKHLCVDRQNNVIIADTSNHVIRKYVPATGTIHRVAGTGQKGSAGVGGPPLELQLNEPHGVYVDRQGTLFIVDSQNHRVLKLVD